MSYYDKLENQASAHAAERAWRERWCDHRQRADGAQARCDRGAGLRGRAGLRALAADPRRTQSGATQQAVARPGGRAARLSGEA